MYYFGVYHWRNGLGAVASIGTAAVLAGVATRLSPRKRAIAGVATAGLGAYGASGLDTLLQPRPWSIQRKKYEALAADLPLSTAESLLDVGCGTGRSLVGLAPALPANCDVTGVDRFDDRIILGNAPSLARHNAREAGLDPSLVVGDATAMPVATDSHDVVTSCMLLHDLPESTARATLSEMRRVCRQDGRMGLIELPLIDDEHTVSSEFWRALVADAGFEEASIRTFPWPGGEGDYTVVTGTPADDREVDGWEMDDREVDNQEVDDWGADGREVEGQVVDGRKGDDRVADSPRHDYDGTTSRTR